jgi:ADP-ribosylglycohydrolase
MLGAIAGDVLGSVYEAQTTKDKDFRLFHELDRPTDDSILSAAVAEAILEAEGAPTLADYARVLRQYGRRYPDAGYGGSYRTWMNDARRGPYNSWGNGSAMRASAVGWAFGSEGEVLRQAELSAAPTHNHPEGIKGAQATALAVFLARSGATKDGIREAIAGRFGYDLSRNVDGIRPGYAFEVSCQASVPEAIIAFLDSTDFEDALRNAISLGGDADTQACIAGAVAEAYYGGVPPRVLAWILPRIEAGLLDTLSRFAARYLPEPQAKALASELESRALPRGADRSMSPHRKRSTRSTQHPAPGYRIVMHGETWKRIQDYAGRLAAEPDLAGARLRDGLSRLPVPYVNAAWLLIALLNTKQPCIFAESGVRGDGSDWTALELGLLGDIGVSVPVTVFDNGRHTGPEVHPVPRAGTLLFIPGALLSSGSGTPIDTELVVDGRIDQPRFEALYERRLVPLLRHASSTALAAGRQALVTVPGLGCGQFAGAFRGSLGARLRDALAAILGRHAPDLGGIRAVWFDPYDECANDRREFGKLSFLIRPLAVNERAGTGFGRSQLCTPTAYEEAGDDYSGCDLYSVVAWDHVSWPGNDYWAGARSTDDGVKAAATDAMFALTGFRGRYEPSAASYLPPEGTASWESLVLEHHLHLRAVDNVTVVEQRQYA